MKSFLFNYKEESFVFIVIKNTVPLMGAIEEFNVNVVKWIFVEKSQENKTKKFAELLKAKGVRISVRRKIYESFINILISKTDMMYQVMQQSIKRA